ncbi:MAG: DUF1592 domain-containing protein [Vicinamibacterales bacterium]|nr:DUF1592 domain-containing protein [Vicinamibacterales bacterium]
MRRSIPTVLGVCAVALGLAVVTETAQRGTDAQEPRSATVAAPAPPAAAPPMMSARAASTRTAASTAATVEEHNATIKQYCSTCHSDRAKAGGLSLAGYDVAEAAAHADVTEKIIVKLQTGMMPPSTARRPDEATYASLITALETRVDAAAARNPNPGRRTFQRLNRTEYTRAIRDLLSLDIDPGKWLPLDQMSEGFDNVADEQTLSPLLLEAYLNAAADISRMAVGDRATGVLDHTYTNPSYVSQHPWDHVPGAPYGTRGGIVVDHVFPADGEYVFEMTFISGDNSRFEDVDVSVGGDRVAFVPYEIAESGGADGRGGEVMRTEPIFVRAGQQTVAAAFIRRTEGPYEDLIRPHDWSYAGGGSGGAGITTLPHLRDIVIKGPYKVAGISETPSRRIVFTCRPTSAAEEAPCAAEIVRGLASRAYRAPLSAERFESLMRFYEEGRAEGDFEHGIRTALEAILSSPSFVFRMERTPQTARAASAYRVNDLALASRLSFFLWGMPPDQELLEIASAGKLNDRELERQARRMLADPRAEALGTRFAGQWLRLQDLDKVKPDPNFYPNFDENLAAAMKRETSLFFYNLVKEDRSALELLSADYSYMNERLARHYGIPGVAGRDFQRVTYPDTNRRGVLGHGSVLVQTSMANRTSPVLRGKWVMEVLLGSPPPPPPPNVPLLEETEGTHEGKMLTTRERLQIHSTNPTCSSCHRMMDPIGIALDNFDVTAKWRLRENAVPLDTRGDFYDGTPVNTPGELSAALMKRPVPLIRTMTGNLLAYALGRRVEYFDQPTIRRIAREAEANGNKMSSFLLGVVRSDAFRMAQADVETSTEAENRAVGR